MKKAYSSSLLFVALSLMPVLAAADDYEGCMSRCEAAHAACVAKTAELANDVEVEDAKAVCFQALEECRKPCNAAENNTPPVQPEDGTQPEK